jgi:hypothetical protein
MRAKTLTYTKDYTTEEGIIIPVEAYSFVVRNHTKRYHNCLYLLAGLNNCARNLMDFLVEDMDDNNIVYSNAHVRDEFISFISEASEGDTNYSESSIKKAFSSLTSKGLLRNISRGIYKVNPKYFIRNSEEQRFNLIKIELEFESNLDTKLRIVKQDESLKDVQPYIEQNEIN